MRNVKLAVIIPTYNEAENISRLIREIEKHTSKEDLIIIVDDNSPDGTARVVARIKKKNVFLLKREGKGGRGTAVLEGFKFAKKFEPKYYLEMDADFSHKPEDIPRLKRKISSEKKDLVIGSRYLKKSKIINWPPKRRIFSRFANLYAKLVLSIPISDYTNGFRIYSSDAVDLLLSTPVKSKGYIVLSETAFILKKAGRSFSEIPIIFVNRKRGESNTNLKEIKEAFTGIVKIRFSA